MLPSDLFGKSLTPPLVDIPDENSGVCGVDTVAGLLTPHKRTTSDQLPHVPQAKRLQLISESESTDSSISMHSGECPIASGNGQLGDVKGRKISSFLCEPAVITSLMEVFNFSDKRSPTPTLPGQYPLTQRQLPTAPSFNICDLKSVTTPVTLTSKLLTSKSLDDGRSQDKSRLSNLSADNNYLPHSPASRRNTTFNSTDLTDGIFDDGDGLLNTLPTSIDDLKDVKCDAAGFERNQSSPVFQVRQNSICHLSAGRNSSTSACSFGIDGNRSSATSNLFEEELDANDLEVAMINQSFEDQQRQFKICCPDNLQTVFYEPPVESSYSITDVSSDSDVLNQSKYVHETLVGDAKNGPCAATNTQAYDAVSKPIIDDLFSIVVDDHLGKSATLPFSAKGAHHLPRSQYSTPPLLAAASAGSPVRFEEDYANATALSSANFVLDSVDSPQKPVYHDSPNMLTFNDNETSEDEELVHAWEENQNAHYPRDSGFYIPRNHTLPNLPLDEIIDPPKNIKNLGHVTEIYDSNNVLDSEPILRYFQSIGMKDFYQRDIDIHRALLVFPSVEEAKYAVENNTTDIKIRLLEESPKFVKLKALKMHMELRPCSHDSEQPSPVLPDPWFMAPIAAIANV